MTEALINKGIKLIGNSESSKKRPVVVIGTARGGTSMVSGVLDKLGLFMGQRAASPVYEDLHLSEAFEKEDDEATIKIINEYQINHTIFGWKRPSSIDNLDRVEKLFDGPKYIFIFKDIFSIANRNSISMFSDTVQGMEKALTQYSKVISFIKEKKPEAMLVSYEKVMMNREEFVRALDKFCGLNASDKAINDSINFIDPAPAEYLEKSRINKAQGRLGGITKERVFYGWARYVYKKEPAIVNFFVNGNHIGSTAADKEREDLRKRFNEACAYQFSLPSDISVNTNDVITARVKGEIRDLENSPLIIP